MWFHEPAGIMELSLFLILHNKDNQSELEICSYELKEKCDLMFLVKYQFKDPMIIRIKKRFRVE